MRGAPHGGQIANSPLGFSKLMLSPSNQYCFLHKAFEDTFLLPLHSTGFAKLLALPTARDSLKRLVICSVDIDVLYLLTSQVAQEHPCQPHIQHSPSFRVISKDSCKIRRLCLRLKNKTPFSRYSENVC